jgi:ribosomal-protein-alanine N-acetyltransferase
MRPNDAEWMSAWERAERPYPWTPAQFTNTLIYKEDGVALGYLVVQVVHDEAHVQNIMVRPDARRRGIAEKMLREAEATALARGATYMVLDVDPQNVAAVRLYQKCGLRQMEERAASYPRGESALIMRKELS